ncbi:type IV pilin N-terminal domain-containing protein [Haladaptatus sp. GCM10025707]|uniref:type IV pilin N-terminal domain-containing protein n=1 Tax=unclassified Haladaptatus TaxID=2622732 RepID=UPI0023E77F27|nr:type IV pilin N-terminal domain-containing protein [Haladaptatus sp. QDMS2]
MHLKQLFTEEDAVSPVIGVILMVAITVILAAVIGTFVLGLGDQVGKTAPQASFSFSYDSGADTLTITHESGDKIKAANLQVKVGNTAAQTWPDDGDSFVTAGDSITVGPSGTPAPDITQTVGSGDTVRVLYNAGSGDSSTLQKWVGPDA